MDHTYGDQLNNTRINLRIANGQNSRKHKISKNSTSGFKGVTFDKRCNRWVAQLEYKECENRVNYVVGRFDSKRKAALAYDKAAREIFGESARTNADLGLLDA